MKKITVNNNTLNMKNINLYQVRMVVKLYVFLKRRFPIFLFVCSFDHNGQLLPLKYRTYSICIFSDLYQD